MKKLLDENKTDIAMFYTCMDCKESFTVKESKIYYSKGIKIITDQIRCPYCGYSKYWIKKLKVNKR